MNNFYWFPNGCVQIRTLNRISVKFLDTFIQIFTINDTSPRKMTLGGKAIEQLIGILIGFT